MTEESKQMYLEFQFMFRKTLKYVLSFQQGQAKVKLNVVNMLSWTEIIFCIGLLMNKW